MMDCWAYIFEGTFSAVTAEKIIPGQAKCVSKTYKNTIDAKKPARLRSLIMSTHCPLIKVLNFAEFINGGKKSPSTCTG